MLVSNEYKSILSCFVKEDVLAVSKLSDIDLNNTTNHKDMGDIYLGGCAMRYLEQNPIIVTGTAPDTQTVKWSDMKTGSDPDAYIEGTNLIGEIVINGSKKYYRLDLSRQLEQGHQPSVTLNKRNHTITLTYGSWCMLF
ncbi:Hypothetical predicted protein [Octopus vulgaris]|uniref:Uncharacterized protein n=1 Tax=Octopus vulgaris TaxID=6645 RepID=A0AA36BNF5_OCTVU|nr:Hypothetical predicted protein [Octopus vulgaris]